MLNTITDLIRIKSTATPPQAWFVFEIENGSYLLHYRYVPYPKLPHPKKAPWVPVVIRSGENKIYKSINAIMNDVFKVSEKPNVLFNSYKLIEGIEIKK